MGARGSHPDIYQPSSSSNSYRYRLRHPGVPRKYSLPAYLSYQPSTKEKFFPPPILHTKLPHLDGNMLNVTISGAVKLDTFLNQNSALFEDNINNDRKSFMLQKTSSKLPKISFPVQNKKEPSISLNLETSIHKQCLPVDPVRRKIATKVSSVSSTSSGVGSGEDSEIDVTAVGDGDARVEKIGFKQKSGDLEFAGKRVPKVTSGLDKPLRSLDSGTSFDEMGAKNISLTDGGGTEGENFETVFEEHENTDGQLTVAEPQQTEIRKKPSTQRKKNNRKYSLAKSFQKMRKRAVSLPTTYVGSLLKKSEKPSTRLFGSSYLHPEWEIVTVKEMCRRLSLDQLDKVFLPLPDGATSSQILDEAMLRQMVDVLPARATGYPWINIYNSEKHGFSLHTFYRKMIEWDEEMSPVLLIIRDCEKNVFGAIVSTTVRPSEHFFGTGDSCLLYKYVINPETGEKELRIYPWSGQNQFFVKASRDSLVVGAGGGHYGLWLDADLNHGRSQACETFHNEPLTNENEDFTVQFIEAYGFRME